jgi:4'-phosphopantetheinyl transferase EntD
MHRPDLRPLVTPAPPHVPGGVLVAVPIVDATEATTAVPAAERALAEALPPSQRGAFLAGRAALRHAVAQVSPESAAAPLLRTPRGAPTLPPAVRGSVSHKRTRAVAIAGPARAPDGHLGIDLEARPDPSRWSATDAAHRARGDALARRILTDRERVLLHEDTGAAGDALRLREALLVRFAIKEAVYKAIDPLVQRYVRFTEVEVDLARDDTARVRLLLPELSDGRVEVTASWQCDDHWIVAIAASLVRER